MINIRPIGGRVLIRREEIIQQDSLIIVPEEQQVKHPTARIEAIKFHNKSDLNVGDLIYFNRYAAHNIDGDLMLIPEDDIWGVIE